MARTNKPAKQPTMFEQAHALNQQYHEFIGYRFEDYHNGGGFWHKPECEGHSRGSSCGCDGHWNLPALHDNIGLLLEELDRVFEYDYDIARCPAASMTNVSINDKPVFIVIPPNDDRVFKSESLAIAGLKALIAAKEGK